MRCLHLVPWKSFVCARRRKNRSMSVERSEMASSSNAGCVYKCMFSAGANLDKLYRYIVKYAGLRHRLGVHLSVSLI